MKKRFVAVIMVLAFIGVCAPVFAESDAYRIGCVFAITGKASWLGEPQRNTVEMIAQEINDAGGINGRPLKLYIEDTAGENTRGVNAVKKLIQKHNVIAIIGPSTSGVSMAVIPVVQEAKIPMISCAAAESMLKPIEERKWIFKVAQNDSDAIRRIYDHQKEKGITKIGIMTDTTGFGAAGRTLLIDMAPGYGITVLADETYSPADTDMTAQLVKIKNSGAEAIVNWSIAPAQSIVPQNMVQLKMTIPLYQSHGFGNIKYAQAAGAAAEGIIFPGSRLLAVDSLAADDPQIEVLMAYKKAYETKYQESASTFGSHAYDALWLIANALKKVGDSPEKLRDELENSQFTGTGGIFKMSSTDHCGLDKYAFELQTVKDGKFVVLKE
jgi:branched-chain amino acid transport system substrate-binding protein